MKQDKETETHETEQDEFATLSEDHGEEMPGMFEEIKNKVQLGFRFADGMIRHIAQKYPLVIVAGAAVVGFGVGRLVSRRSE